MREELRLVGLRSLEEVCKRYSLAWKTQPPSSTSPAPDELFLGQPFDPILAALYGQIGAAVLGDFQLYPFGNRDEQASSINQGMRSFGEEPYLSSVLFGQIPMLAYYLATVPALADANGIQPVIFIDGYEGHLVLPVASSVDQFLLTFSMYLERAVLTPEYAMERNIRLHFPTQVPDLVARDHLLLSALSEGRFDQLMRGAEESRDWVASVTSAAR
jgi:hypothetical protein